MAEFRITDAAPGAGNGCICCGEFEGPFVDLQILVPPPIYQGYLCAPTERRPGCAGQIAQLIGYHNSLEVQTHETEIGDLKKTNAELRKKLRAKEFTVTGDELLELVTGERRGSG